MSRASLKRRARFFHARNQKGRIRIIKNALAPVERKPDGSLYRMTPAQHCEAKKIIRRLCSNYCEGNCNHSDLPDYEIEKIARCILPDILALFDSEEGQKEFAEWKARQEKKGEVDA